MDVDEEARYLKKQLMFASSKITRTFLSYFSFGSHKKRKQNQTTGSGLRTRFIVPPGKYHLIIGGNLRGPIQWENFEKSHPIERY